MKKTITLAAALCTASIGIVACGESTETGMSTDNTTSVTAGATDASATSDSTGDSAIELVDGYCRAKPDADDDDALEHATDLDKKHSDMTPCFGTLRNNSDADITVVAFAAPSLEGVSTELHEVVDGMMQEKPGGFTIPAGDTYELVPGGDHLMIMNFPDELEAGDIVPVEITLDDGTTYTIDIPVREQPSGEENYAGNEDDHGDHGDDGNDGGDGDDDGSHQGHDH